MKRLIYIIAFIFSIGAFAQGGPKVDVIKFRGEVTTAVRNTFNVPVGETWLIYNATSGLLEIAGDDDVWESVGDGIQEGANSIPLGISLNQGLTNTIQVLPDLNGNPSIRIIGGNGDDAVYQVMSDDKIDWNFTTNSRNYQLNASGPTIGTDLTDKAYVDAQVSAGGTDDQTAAEVPFTNTTSGLTAIQVQAAIDEVEARVDLNDAKVTNTDDQTSTEVPFTPNGSIVATNTQTAIQEVRDEAPRLNLTNTFQATQQIQGGFDVGSYIYQGVDIFASGRRWQLGKNFGQNTFNFNYQDASNTDTSGAYTTIATINSTGTPSAATDLIDKAYADATYSTGGSLPAAYEVTAYNALTSGQQAALPDYTLIYNDDGPIGTVIPDDNSVTSAKILNGTIDELDLDASINTSLDLADSSVQSLNGVTSANITNGTIDEIDLDTSVNASLDLADSSIQTLTATTGTGTALNLGGYYQYNMSTASTSATFTVTNITAGGYAESLINKSGSAPTVTGATPLPNTQAFIASTPMILSVKAFGSTVKYWFTEF